MINPPSALGSFTSIFRIMNDLKRRKIINDWTIYGSIAYIYYTEVIFTRDIDLFITTAAETPLSLPAYRTVLAELAYYTEVSKVDAGTFRIGNVHFQVFEATGNPFWEDAVKKSKRDTVGGIDIKVASAEHLILLALMRFSRSKDWVRIAELYKIANKKKVGSLLKRFEADGTLTKRWEQLKPYLV